MSVYFSKHSINGYRDPMGTVDPAIRDRLLSAINELTVLGPGLPRHRDRIQTASKSRSTRTTNRTKNDRSAPYAVAQEKTGKSLQLKQVSSAESPVVHGVLKEKIKYKKGTASTDPEKGNVIVYAKVLHQEAEYKTIPISILTTSEELVNTVLTKYDAHTKDPNLFYLAMETGIKSKDSGLPISQMIVLEDDARPLELQACQPQGETKFHLKMKSGGLVRVRTNILNPGTTFKTVFIARCTTAQELIKLVINGCKSDESPENFVLREGSTNYEVDRILGKDEYPVEIQSTWKPEEERSFFLSRVNKTRDTIPPQTVERSDELKNEIEKQNQTIDTLNDTIKKLQEEHSLDVLRRQTTSSVDSGFIKDDYDQIDDINCNVKLVFEPPQHEEKEDIDENDFDEDQNRLCVERIRQRKTSIDALDLHQVPVNLPINGHDERKRSGSQISKLRRSFTQYKFQKHSIDALDLCDGKKDQTKKTDSRNSQIEKFRLKFLEYYNVKSDGTQRRISSVLTPPRPRRRTESQKNDQVRSYSASDAEFASVDLQFDCELQTVFSRKSSMNSTCDKEIEEVFENSSVTRELPSDDSNKSSNLFIYDILEEMALISVAIQRDPGMELGLEIARVTQAGSPVADGNDADGDVVYVFHKGDGETAVIESPTEHTEIQNGTTVTEEDPSRSKHLEDDRDEVFSPVNFESRLNDTIFGPNTTTDEGGTRVNHVKHENGKTFTNFESCTALSSWRKGVGPKVYRGVRIVGIAKGSLAEETGKLARGDVIVEVNGRIVLNSSLDVVIATLKERNTVQLVVARERETLGSNGNTVEPSPVQSPLPSYHEDMQALTDQVQQLVAKVTELQDSLTKKDKTIASLKKSLIKKKLRISSKEKVVEGEQVMV